jgi:hypothetical protein
MSKAIAALVRQGLEAQESRGRESFRNLKANLANDDPSQQDQLEERQISRQDHLALTHSAQTMEAIDVSIKTQQRPHALPPDWPECRIDNRDI